MNPELLDTVFNMKLFERDLVTTTKQVLSKIIFLDTGEPRPGFIYDGAPEGAQALAQIQQLNDLFEAYLEDNKAKRKRLVTRIRSTIKSIQELSALIEQANQGKYEGRFPEAIWPILNLAATAECKNTDVLGSFVNIYDKSGRVICTVNFSSQRMAERFHEKVGDGNVLEFFKTSCKIPVADIRVTRDGEIQQRLQAVYLE